MPRLSLLLEPPTPLSGLSERPSCPTRYSSAQVSPVSIDLIWSLGRPKPHPLTDDDRALVSPPSFALAEMRRCPNRIQRASTRWTRSISTAFTPSLG